MKTPINFQNFLPASGRTYSNPMMDTLETITEDGPNLSMHEREIVKLQDIILDLVKLNRLLRNQVRGLERRLASQQPAHPADVVCAINMSAALEAAEAGS